MSTQSVDKLSRDQKSKRTVFILGSVVVGMFGFGFALVPLYQVFCNVTGFNGSQQGRQADVAYTGGIDAERTVTVEFDSTINTGLPWDFYPLTKRMDVHPGQMYEVNYIAKNNADKSIVAQAVPGVTPWQATRHFNKTECFCFTNQTLKAGESREMPLRFRVSTELPKDINTLTLSYTFMNIDRNGNRKAADLEGDDKPAIKARAESTTSHLSMNATVGDSLR